MTALIMEAEHLLHVMGLSINDGIRLFLHQVVAQGGIPFNLTVPTPNKTTQEAIEELESGHGTQHKTLKSLFNDLKH